MSKRISFSGDNPSIADVALHYNDASDALKLFFSEESPTYTTRFFEYSPQKVREELSNRLAELDLNTIMSLFGALEAAFRIDYLQRCNWKLKDVVSRKFRDIHKEKDRFVSLEEDILRVWKTEKAGVRNLLGELVSALNLRNWIAHGRYWNPRLGRKYDYIFIYALASEVLSSLPLLDFQSLAEPA